MRIDGSRHVGLAFREESLLRCYLTFQNFHGCFLTFKRRPGLKYRSRVQVIAPLINYQTIQIPLDLIEHFVKRLGLGDSFNVVHLSLSW